MSDERAQRQALTEQQLQRWGLIEVFLNRLAGELADCPLATTWADPKRQLQLAEYPGLFLFGLLNPAVKTMRALCAASRLERVQQEICGRPVSLGSFSEAQAVVEPQLLADVYASLQTECVQRQRTGDPRLERYAPVLAAVDSTLRRALPRMSWALWRRQGTTQRAVRLHVKFGVLTQELGAARVTPGRQCERAQWRRWARPGEFYVGDRYYGEDYGLLGELAALGCDYVVRLRQEARWVVETELPLDPADRQAQVTWSGWVRLGVAGTGPRVRPVRVRGDREELLLVTNTPPAELAAELIGLIYRHRWQVELFFRWLKCILGCRHWLAESPEGVALQVYLALIAARLLLLLGGQRRPTRRQMELIQMYLLGWATAAELVAGLKPAAPTR